MNDDLWTNEAVGGLVHALRAELADLRAEHAEMAALLARIQRRGSFKSEWLHDVDAALARIQGEAR